MSKDSRETDESAGNFVRDIVLEDLEAGRRERVVTRFPPEPNGYLHIGHAKSIVLNFGLARELGGQCNLRFDDTNPEKESVEYVESIQRDVKWLGYDWGENLFFASDYFEQLYAWAEQLIRDGKAYVDSQSPEQIKAGRGSFHEPGVESPYRDRSVEENLALFAKMRAGEIGEGEAVLRAKIDMQSKDLKLRDPLMYRIRKVHHHRTGDAWCIYPMYDWAHGQSDAIEGVTHSICTLEFVNHRALYDWFLEALGQPEPPKQYEMAKLQLDHVVLSKRRLLQLVEEGHVDGWDDPRMPTISGLRRRGYPPEAIVAFCERIGVSKNNTTVDVGLLEHSVREELNAKTPRYMGVLDPVKLVIENWEEGEVIDFEMDFHPEDPSFGKRKVPFSGELWIEREDFLEEAPRKWFRLSPGKEVRLRYAALVTCTGFEKDEDGNVTLIRCTWDPESKGGRSPDGRKVKGTLHWVSAAHAVDAEVRLYDRLFTDPNPTGHGDKSFLEFLNADSKEVRPGCKLEPAAAELEAGTRFQLERLGYFVADEVDHQKGAPVLNRTITLKDTWAKIKGRR